MTLSARRLAAPTSVRLGQTLGKRSELCTTPRSSLLWPNFLFPISLFVVLPLTYPALGGAKCTAIAV